MAETLSLYMGIDNGLDGGIVVMDSDGKIKSKHIMPTIQHNKGRDYDIEEISQIIRSFATVKDHMNIKVKCILETAQVRPVSGKRACFTNGFGFGMMQGLLTAHNISFEIVTPQTWMKTILKGFNTKDKKASILWCKRKYPDIDWHKTNKCAKYHDGMTDACCMAEYGRRLK